MADAIVNRPQPCRDQMGGFAIEGKSGTSSAAAMAIGVVRVLRIRTSPFT